MCCSIGRLHEKPGSGNPESRCHLAAAQTSLVIHKYKAATVHVCLTHLQEFFWWQGEGISLCERVRVIPADSISILAFVSCIQWISDYSGASGSESLIALLKA